MAPQMQADAASAAGTPWICATLQATMPMVPHDAEIGPYNHRKCGAHQKCHPQHVIGEDQHHQLPRQDRDGAGYHPAARHKADAAENQKHHRHVADLPAHDRRQIIPAPAAPDSQRHVRQQHNHQQHLIVQPQHAVSHAQNHQHHADAEEPLPRFCGPRCSFLPFQLSHPAPPYSNSAPPASLRSPRMYNRGLAKAKPPCLPVSHFSACPAFCSLYRPRRTISSPFPFPFSLHSGVVPCKCSRKIPKNLLN